LPSLEIGGDGAAQDMSAGGALRCAAGAEAAREGGDGGFGLRVTGLDVSSLKLAPRDRQECPGARGLLGRKVPFKVRPRQRKAQVVAAILADPALSDAAVGRLFGVSAEAVRQVRVAGGLPRESAAMRRRAAIIARLVEAPELSMAAIGREFGVSEKAVRLARATLKGAR
jgi:hypothetical protein